MGIEEFIEALKQSGGILAIEQEEGAADGLDQVRSLLQDYEIQWAVADRVVPAFELAMPKYADSFRIGISPKVLSAYFINNRGMLLAKHERRETGLDSDIFAGMLEAVNSFVKDSLEQMGGEEGSAGGINALAYHDSSLGDVTIHISRKKEGILAATFQGEFSKDAYRALEQLNADMHERHSEKMSSWNGHVNQEWIDSIRSAIRMALFDSRRFEGDLDLTALNSEKMLAKSRAIDIISNEAKNRKLAFVFDSAQDMDAFSAELVQYFGRNTKIPIVIQYQVGLLDEGINNPALIDVFENLGKENKFHHLALKSEIDMESLVNSRLSEIGDVAFELLRHSAVADEFDAKMLAEILEMPLERVGGIQKQLNDAGILKGNRLANSRIKQRAVESIPEERKGQMDRDIADALERKGKEYSPRIAELLLPYADMNEELREKTIYHLIQSAEQFTLVMNFDKALDHYLKAVDIDHDNKRKMDSLEKVLQIEWETTKWDALIQHADILESIANQENDLRMKGISCQKRANVFVRKNDFNSAEKNLDLAEKIFEILDDLDLLVNAKNSKAVYFIGRGMYSEALSILEKTLSLCENDLENGVLVLSNIGSVYQERKEFDKAISTFDKCLNLPKNKNFLRLESNILFNKSLIYSHLGDLETSISLGKEAISKSLLVGDILTASKAFNTIGNVYMDDLKDFEKARENFEQAVKYARVYSSPISEAIFMYNLGELHSLLSEDYTNRSEKMVVDNNLEETNFGASIKKEIDKRRLEELKRASIRLGIPIDSQ